MIAARQAIRRFLWLGLAILGLAAPAIAPQAQPPSNQALLLTIDGPIGPATSDYIGRGLAEARERGAKAVVLQMDTPGGLDTSMRAIIEDILASPVPVLGYVAPSGARAASAGTYILYASHVAAMAPATNLGAATPVQLGGGGLMPDGDKPEKDVKDTANGTPKGGEANGTAKDKSKKPGLAEKAINDAKAYIRGLAQLRGRNAEWAVKAVDEAASLPAEDALEQGVIDLMAGSVRELLEAADGREVSVAGETRRLETAELAVEAIEPDWRTEFLSIVTNPNVAYLLLLAGLYGLLFEFMNPGAVVPGVVGAIALLIALYALHVLPVSYAGLGLLLLGLGLMVAEAFAPSFGILGFGGVVAFVVGSVLLMDTDVPGFGISMPLIGSIAGVTGAGFALILIFVMRARRRPVVSGGAEMMQDIGEVTEWSGRAGEIKVRGERWQARAEKRLKAGQAVRVIEIDGLTLVVEPVEGKGGP